MNDTITLQLSAKEAIVLSRALQSHNPSMEDELIVVMLYNKLMKLLGEKR